MPDNYTGEERRGTDGWHLNRNVSLGQIVVLVLTVISLILWYAEVNGRLEYHDKRISALGALIEKNAASIRSAADSTRNVSERLARIDERTTLILQELKSNRDNK